jgi:hypothetical protein
MLVKVTGADSGPSQIGCTSVEGTVRDLLTNQLAARWLFVPPQSRRQNRLLYHGDLRLERALQDSGGARRLFRFRVAEHAGRRLLQ